MHYLKTTLVFAFLLAVTTTLLIGSSSNNAEASIFAVTVDDSKAHYAEEYIQQTATASDIPVWSEGELKKIVKNFTAASDAFFKPESFRQLTPRQKEKLGEKIGNFYSDNRALIGRQPMVAKMFVVYLAAEGFISRPLKVICDSAKEADAFFINIDRKGGSGLRLEEFLKLHFDIDSEFMPRFYASKYAVNNDLVRSPKQCCGGDMDDDGFCDEADCCPKQEGVAPCGCPVIKCEDTDLDDVCDKDDDCPLLAGPVSNNGRPVCPDADNDCTCDDEDDCPNEAGFTDNHGCPIQDTINMTNGGMYIIGPEMTYYEKGKRRFENSDAFQMLTDIIINEGGLKDGVIELSQAKTNTELGDQFANSPYLLLRLEFLQKNGKQVIVFDAGKYRIISELDPDRYPSFVASFENFVKCLQILRFDLNFTGNDFLILAQGKADSPTMPKTLIQPDDQWEAFTNSIFYQYDKSTGTMIRSSYKLEDKYYMNPDLPYLRAAWLMQQLKAQAILGPYVESMITLEGIVLEHVDPEERSGTLFVALHKENAAAKLLAIKKRLEMENQTSRR